MKKLFYTFISLFAVFSWLIPGAVQVLAQSDPQLTLTLRRNFGYSGGSDIQGTFTMTATGPDNLTRVVFSIDGKAIGEANQAPFKLQFTTDSYSLGMHQLSAIGFTATGDEIPSNVIQANFVSASQGWQAALKFVIPVLVVIAIAILLSIILPIVFQRRRKPLPLGAPRNYGALGGTVCPKCGRPFALHIYGINMLAGKLERCPHCGKWSLVRRATPDELARAEAAEKDQSGEGTAEPALNEEERLRREMEESKYQDL